MVRLTITLLFSFFAGIAQTTIVPIFQTTNYGDNVYFKDVDNNFTPYVGTWKYINGTDTLTIVLQKKEMVYSPVGTREEYLDYLIGEYKYVKNGVEKVNTLSALSSNYPNALDYNLVSDGIVVNAVHPQCNNCFSTQRRISMSFNEPSRREIAGLSAGLMLRRITESDGVQKIIAILYTRSVSFGFTYDGTPSTIDSYSVPIGEYVLTKIN